MIGYVIDYKTYFSRLAVNQNTFQSAIRFSTVKVATINETELTLKVVHTHFQCGGLIYLGLFILHKTHS